MGILKRLCFSAGLLFAGVLLGLFIIEEKPSWLSNYLFGKVKSVSEVVSSGVSPVQHTYFKWQDKDKVWHYSEQPNIFATNKMVTVNLAANVLPSPDATQTIAEPEGKFGVLSQMFKKAAFIQQKLGISEKDTSRKEKFIE